jgi:hypothetical protein
VWQSFLSIFPHILGGTMATSQTCCHLPGEMLNSAAECADRHLIIDLTLLTIDCSLHISAKLSAPLPMKIIGTHLTTFFNRRIMHGIKKIMDMTCVSNWPIILRKLNEKHNLCVHPKRVGPGKRHHRRRPKKSMETDNTAKSLIVTPGETKSRLSRSVHLIMSV